MNIAMIKTNRKTIKKWAADDRPREKMISKGRGSLSNAELIAILIRSGSDEQTAVDLAREVLDAVGDNLYDLSKLSIDELQQHKGIGEAKAVSIAAALELGRRWSATSPEQRESINSSQEAYERFLALIDDPTKEHFLVAYLNRGNKVIKVERISTGGITATLASRGRWPIPRSSSRMPCSRKPLPSCSAITIHRGWHAPALRTSN